MPTVQFVYYTGVHEGFESMEARLAGSWDAAGNFAESWSSRPMRRETAEDGCPCFTASVDFSASEINREFRWGVAFASGGGEEQWAIPTEIQDRNSTARFRVFQLRANGQKETYYLTHCRRLGANRVRLPNGSEGIRFAVWAPNAQKAEVVIGKLWDARDPRRDPARGPVPETEMRGGFITDSGLGTDPSYPFFPMTRDADGVWTTSLDEPALRDFQAMDHKLYMYRITRDDGVVVFRTDLYSRCQIGWGTDLRNTGDEAEREFLGSPNELDGRVSCSVVINPGTVTRAFKEDPAVFPPREFIPAPEFWRDEFTGRTVPSRVEDLVIYELFLGALGYGSPKPGTLEDAIAILPYLERLGVNTIELLPMCEFGGGDNHWGYGSSHHFAIEFSGGGRDQFKIFIKECHRHGFAVIIDVVYNHFTYPADRAEAHYDSIRPNRDIYYWYEGDPASYSCPDGGYVDNDSTGYAPRYWDEMVRKMFISSAVALIQEFHADGFRVDQTTSIHSYNKLHTDKSQVANANIFGAKLLREFSRTLRMFKPGVMLMAEDHSTWAEVTRPAAQGGLGFDARWYADFYHNLAGDTKPGDFGPAKLLYTAATRRGTPLAMDSFAGALASTGNQTVVYHESHDEAGNSDGPFFDPHAEGGEKKCTSHRTIVTAVAQAPLIGDTRRYAEARSRFAAGMAMLSAGTPMFLFGEEVGAERRFKYDRIMSNKEDFLSMETRSGANLFRFYADVIRFRLANEPLRSRNIDVIYTHNANRIIAFRRWDASREFLIVASLNDDSFADGYTIYNGRLADGPWEEVFNSDSSRYGGDDVGNFGSVIRSANEAFTCRLPRAGFVVFAARPKG